MSKSNETPLNAQSKDYILKQTDAGATPRQILLALHASGQSKFELATVEGCLQDNDAKKHAHGYPELKDLPPIPTPERANPYSGRAARVASNPTGEKQAATTNNTAQASAQAQANAVPGFQWNKQADNFAISAYNVEFTASQIAFQLRSHGYDDVTVGEVVASLNRQGVANVRW